ncbi:MAG: hypothetical protein WAM96_11750, partial [Candidatus Acidiferrales bacterium]
GNLNRDHMALTLLVSNVHGRSLLLGKNWFGLGCDFSFERVGGHGLFVLVSIKQAKGEELLKLVAQHTHGSVTSHPQCTYLVTENLVLALSLLTSIEYSFEYVLSQAATAPHLLEREL